MRAKMSSGKVFRRGVFITTIVLLSCLLTGGPAVADEGSDRLMAVYARIFSYFERQGYSVERPEGEGFPALTRIERTEVLNGGEGTSGDAGLATGSADLQASPVPVLSDVSSGEEAGRLEAGDWSGGYSIDSSAKVSVRLCPGAAWLANEIRESGVPGAGRRRGLLEKKATGKGTALNVPRNEETAWVCGENRIDDPMTSVEVFDFREAEGSCLSGTRRWSWIPMSAVGRPDVTDLEHHMNLTFLQGNVIVSVDVNLVEYGSGIFRDRVERSAGAVAVLGGLYMAMTGLTLSLPDEVREPLLPCESVPTPVSGDVLPGVDVEAPEMSVLTASDDSPAEPVPSDDVKPGPDEAQLPVEKGQEDIRPASPDAKVSAEKEDSRPEGSEIQDPEPADEPTLRGIITGNRVNFRSSPSVSGEILGKLDKGEQIGILKEWTPPAPGEAVLNDACEIEVGGETLRLPNGFGVTITDVDEKVGTVTVSFLRKGEKVSGKLVRQAVSSTKGNRWYLVKRQDGTEGWAFGKYVDLEEGPPVGPGPDVQYLYYQALDLLGEDKKGEALFKLDQLLELYPGHVDALFERGRCLAAMKRYEEALESFWEIPFYAPSHPLYLAWTGYCYQAMKQHDRALLAYLAVLRLHPDHSITDPVSDHILQCQKLLGLNDETLPAEQDVKSFIFDRWDDYIAEEIWKGTTRGKGFWDTW